MAILFTLRVFARNLLEEIAEEMLLVFCLDDWPGARTLAFRLISQHTRHQTTATSGYRCRTQLSRQQRETANYPPYILIDSKRSPSLEFVSVQHVSRYFCSIPSVQRQTRQVPYLPINVLNFTAKFFSKKVLHQWTRDDESKQILFSDSNQKKKKNSCIVLMNYHFDHVKNVYKTNKNQQPYRAQTINIQNLKFFFLIFFFFFFCYFF